MTLFQLFATAQANGFKAPTLRVGDYKLKPAPAHGVNPGAIYITDSSNGEYYGLARMNKGIVGGLVLRLNASYPGTQSELVEAIYEPGAAAIKYGHQTGNCSICGRRLDNAISVQMGIGPICADKLGIPRPDSLPGADLSVL